MAAAAAKLANRAGDSCGVESNHRSRRSTEPVSDEDEADADDEGYDQSYVSGTMVEGKLGLMVASMAFIAGQGSLPEL